MDNLSCSISAFWAVSNIIFQVFQCIQSHFQFLILSETDQIRKLPSWNYIYTSRNCSGFVAPLTHKEKKIGNKTSSLWSCLLWFWIWNLKLERRIRKVLSPECLNIYKFLIAISVLFVLSILLAILGYLPVLFFSNAAFRTQNIPLRILVLNVNQNRKYGSL